MPRLYNILIALLFLLPFRIVAQQQNYIFQHLTKKDGLAANVITHIFQDSRGFYWLGNNNELQKFDGQHFSNVLFKSEPPNNSLVSTLFINPIEDKEGNIWVHDQGSIIVYHTSDRIDTIRIKDDRATTTASDILNFCIDGEGIVWIFTRLYIYSYLQQFNPQMHIIFFNASNNQVCN